MKPVLFDVVPAADRQALLDLQIGLWNLECYLKYTPLPEIKFADVREQLMSYEQQRNAIFFKQGSR